MGAFGYLDKEKLQGVCMAGELGLNGEVKGIRGVLSIIDTAEKNGCSLCIVPKKNLPEAVSAGRIKILGISSLKEFLEHAKEDDWGLRSSQIVNGDRIRKDIRKISQRSWVRRQQKKRL